MSNFQSHTPTSEHTHTQKHGAHTHTHKKHTGHTHTQKHGADAHEAFTSVRSQERVVQRQQYSEPNLGRARCDHIAHDLASARSVVSIAALSSLCTSLV